MLRELINTFETKHLPITALRTDGGTQMRAALDDGTVFEYTQAMIAANGWGTFPPAVAYYDGSAYWLGDGFHRVKAYREAFPASADGIPCDIRAGTRRDAVLHAAGANASHGLRRSQADKRRSVETLLRDDEWGQWSDNEIARRCNVSPTTVGTVRKELSLSKLDSEKPAAAPAERVFVNRHGQTSTMRVDAIGKAANKASDEQIEAVIRSYVASHATKPATLRTAARSRKGHWLFDTITSNLQSAQIGEWSQTRVVNIMQNVADDLEQDQPQPAPPRPEQRQYEAAVPAIDVAPDPALVPPGLDGRVRHNAQPAALPADLASRGWELRQVPGSGRWYANNKSGPRATAIFDKPEDAIAAAYEMQRDLRAQIVEPEPTSADNDLDTLDKLLNCNTAQGVLQGMLEYWHGADAVRVEARPHLTEKHRLIVSVAVLTPDGTWRQHSDSTLAGAIRKVDLAL